ncbi:MAG: FkbM family methyltransferase [Rubrivivax sp.]|nr:FkbM family methyltransferase [Rubrivivax sp.]
MRGAVGRAAGRRRDREPAVDRLNRLLGLARSLAIYHGIPGRQARLAGFYGALVPRGGLAFDIGAHVGSRVRVWRRLGARVLAVEPQPECLRVLRWLFAGDAGVTVLAQAVGEREGMASLLVSPRTPTVSTLSRDWAGRVGALPAFAGVRWTEELRVPLTTLDALIARHGRPDFVKIDVEGSEPAVLAGLTQPLPALSFEVLAALPEAALACIERLESLGRHRYRACAGERFRWLQPAPVDAAAMRRWVGELASAPALARHAASGDIYAWHDGAGGSA